MDNLLKPKHLPALLNERDRIIREQRAILRYLFPSATEAKIDELAQRETRREMMRRMRARKGN